MTATVLFRDGFNGYVDELDLLSIWQSCTFPTFEGFGPGRISGNAVTVSGAGFFQTPNFTPASDITVAFAFEYDPNFYFNILDGLSGSSLFNVSIPSRNSMIVATGGVSHTLALSENIAIGSWSQLQFRGTIASGTLGGFDLVANGVDTIVSLHSISTVNGSISSADAVQIGLVSNSGVLALDDVVAATGGWLGDVHLSPMRPVGDVTAQLIPLSGTSNFAMVDEVQLNRSNYNSAASITSGGDTLTMGTVALATNAVILEISTNVAFEKIGSGTAAVTPGIISGTVASTGTQTTAIASTFSRAVTGYANNPNGSVPWTEAAVNAPLKGTYSRTA